MDEDLAGPGTKFLGHPALSAEKVPAGVHVFLVLPPAQCVKTPRSAGDLSTAREGSTSHRRVIRLRALDGGRWLCRLARSVSDWADADQHAAAVLDKCGGGKFAPQV